MSKREELIDRETEIANLLGNVFDKWQADSKLGKYYGVHWAMSRALLERFPFLNMPCIEHIQPFGNEAESYILNPEHEYSSKGICYNCGHAREEGSK